MPETIYYRKDAGGAVAIGDLTNEICERLGIERKYVYRLDINIDTVTAYLFKGRDGFGRGAKYVILDEDSPLHGEAALEPPITFRVST